jgi:hypothetical protein
MIDQDRMLKARRITRTTCATAPVCRIRLKTSPPMKDAGTPAVMDANRGKCGFIIAKSTASIS